MYRLLLCEVLILLATGHAYAGDPYLKEGPPTSALIGHVEFCRRHPQECRPHEKSNIHLTPTLSAALAEVQETVNSQVQAATDLELYGRVEFWTYPKSGKGDCEDYVLLKRKLLMKRGWPGSALRLTLVREDSRKEVVGSVNGIEYHLVLAAVTDHGIYILDNKRPDVEEWHATPYTYVKWTSGSNPRLWVQLIDQRIDLRAKY